MVRTIIGMISQCHFYVHIGKSKSSCRTLLNGVWQVSIITQGLFNLYTDDIPTIYWEST